MTQYAVGKYELTLKVEYADPAGSCAGWFLFTHNFHSVPAIDVVADPETAAILLTDGGVGGGGTELHAAVKARLERMFGLDGVVSYTIRMVQSVTPATIDVDY